MEIFEGMYGTSRSSYLTLEGKNGSKGARMIVRHSQKVDESKLGARSRFVESILIENADGERMRFPTVNLVPARAMAHHVSMGGGFSDVVGTQIGRNAQDFANLGACSSYVAVNAGTLSEGAVRLREQCRCKMREMKKTFERMYRSDNGYLTEAKRIEDEARTLTEGDGEVAIPPEKLDEVRKTLNLENSAILADAVFESVCKCVTEAALAEKADPQPMVSVLGREVNAAAWDKLKTGEIELFGKPKTQDFKGDGSNPAGYTDKSGELLHKLGSIVPVVRDDSLMNLLGFVCDRMPEERDPAVAQKMRTLARFVVKAAGLSMNEGLAEGNRTIRGFNAWIAGFDTAVVLREDFSINPYEADTSDMDRAEAQVDDEFDVEEFLASKFGMDLVRDRPRDEWNAIHTGEIKSALTAYLSSWSEHHTDQYIDDTAWIADKKLGEVIAHLARDGFMVSSDASEEGATMMGDDPHHHGVAEDGDEFDPMLEDGDLTREDVLLPHPNQGQSLKREVTPRSVKDPDTGKDTLPDEGYINRLRALSGLNTQNRQS